MALALSDVVASATTADSAPGATRTVNLPISGVSEGNMMFLLMSIHKEAADIGDVLTTPTGWTRVTEQGLPTTTSTPRAYLYKRPVPNGGLGSTVDITSSDTAIGHAAVAFAIQNADEALDILGTWNTGTGTTVTFPAVTAVNVDGLIIRIAVLDDDKQSSQPALTDHTAVNWAELMLPVNGSTILAYKALQPSTAAATGTITISEEQWAANTFVISEVPTGSAETLRPDGEFSDAGLVTNSELDHDEDPDSVSVTIDATGNNVNTDWGGDFPTPSGDPDVGTDLQEFRVGVEEFDSGQTGTPNARIELWENGTLVRAGNNTAISTYQVLSFKWNANELATADGGLVQCKLIGSKSGGSPSARNTVRIGHMEWNVTFTAGSTTFFETPAMTSTGVAGLGRALTASRAFTIVAANSVALGRTISLTKAVGATVAPSLARVSTFSRALAVTVIGTAALSHALLFEKALAITATGGVALVKTIGLPRGMLATGATSLARTISLTKAIIVAAAPVVGKTVGLSKVIVATGAAGLTQGLLSNISPVMTAIGVAGLTKTTVFIKTLSQLVVGIAGFSKTFIEGSGGAAVTAITAYAASSLFRLSGWSIGAKRLRYPFLRKTKL